MTETDPATSCEPVIWQKRPSAIDVWSIELDHTLRQTSCDEDAGLLSPDELARANRFVFPAKRASFIAGRSSLRRRLAQYLAVAPCSVSFEYGKHGKPRLATGVDFAFNLSHSATRAMLVVAQSSADNISHLGIDVEQTRSGRALLEIAKRFFSAEESKAMLESIPEQRDLFFYQMWARKEAYLKAWGTGLSFQSNRFSLLELDGQVTVHHTEMPGDTLGATHLVDLSVEGAYRAAVCWVSAMDSPIANLNVISEIQRS